MRAFFTLFFPFLLLGCSSNSKEHTTARSASNQRLASQQIDWQGHRGARGLLPENTIPAFLKALEYPITTLELDVVISKDSQAVVSHEPWMSHEICNLPNGEAVTAADQEKYNLYQLTYAEIKQFDCGSRGNERFSEQQPLRAYKPSLLEAVTQVELYCKKNNVTPPRYNIEIKSQPDYDHKFTPPPAAFVRIVLDDLDVLDIKKRTTIQSFDSRSLEAVHQQDSSVATAYLVYQPGVERQMDLLSYTPEIYSPYYLLLNPATIDSVKKMGMRIIPWTINDVQTMQRLIAAGVDGIITDYPNLITQIE